MQSYRTSVQLDTDLTVESYFMADTPEQAVEQLVRYLRLEFAIPEDTAIRMLQG